MTSILKVDTIQDTAGNNIINESSDTITIGASGDTVNIVGTLQNNGSGLVSGITMAQQWRLTADLTNSADPISSNLEIADTDGYGGIGSSMTESSGTFTFPSTGIYLIIFNILQRTISTADYCQGIIKTTTNNSTYDVASDGRTNSSSSATAFSSTSTSFMFDVTDVTTHKVRFQITQAEASNTILGSTSINYTSFTFIRLGDT
jgi:hypothetical protein